MKDLERITTLGYSVSSKVQEGGPPPAQAVAIKLIADSAKDLDAVIRISQDFEKELRTYNGVKNITNSSGETPGQFVFTLKKDVIALLGIPPSTIIDQVTSLLNGVSVGTISDRGEDLDIVVKYHEFTQSVNPDLITAHQFKWAGKIYRLGEVINLDLTNAVASIKREAGKITVSVGSDTEEGVLATEIQQKFTTYAEQYDFPDGISFSRGGENQENADLIQAVLTAFFLAILAIFAILTLQFNSYKQPIIVLYSVMMAIPFVFLGLLLTGNKMSLSFGIGFIAFTGIAVNHGIILIDAININLRK